MYGNKISSTVSNVSVGTLVSGHTLNKVSLDSSIVDVGEGTISTNNITIKDSNGNNVTNNYNITKDNTGKVTITCANIAEEPIIENMDYTGEEITGVTGGKYVTVSGVKKATEIGEYNVNVTLNKNYCWSDKTTTSKEYVWNIKYGLYTITYNTNDGYLLPDEYTRLEYIESTGTQYINTGYIPNQDTSVSMDAQMISSSTTIDKHYAYFGARDTVNAKYFSLIKADVTWDLFWQYNNQYPYFEGGTQDLLGTRKTITTNKNVATVNGASLSVAYNDFDIGYTMYLFGCNDNNRPSWLAPMKLYSAQIYDDGVMVRNYIPVKTSNGTIGLYDIVNGVFYVNEGTGTFTAGPEIKNNPIVNDYTVESNDILLPIPFRVGYTFDGWYTNEDLTGEAMTQITKGSFGNKKLYAKWTPITYTINFYDNLNYMSEKDELIVTLAGRTFYKGTNGGALVAYGFDTSNNCTGPVLVSTSSDSVKFYSTYSSTPLNYGGSFNVNNNLVYYHSIASTWMCNTSSSSFPDTSGLNRKIYTGTSPKDIASQMVADQKSTLSSQFTYNISKKLPANTYTKTGYNFIGWSTTPTGSVIYKDSEIVNNLTIKDNDVINLYAIYKVKQPIMAPSNVWYKGTTDKSTITKVIFSNNYIATGNETESWPAAVDSDGDGTLDDDIMCYLNGTELTIASNGVSKIYANSDSTYMFYGFSSVTSFDNIKFLDTKNVTNMSFMFAYCSSLTSLDLSTFNTSNVISFWAMFRDSTKLSSINLSSFDTSKATSLSVMFLGCSSLVNIDVSNFDTSNAIYLDYMFEGVGATVLDLSNFDTRNVTNTSYMFNGCSNLTTIYVGDYWDMSNVTSSTSMFNHCRKLVGGIGTTWNVSYIDKTYARVDGLNDQPGYLTHSSTIAEQVTWYNLTSLGKESVTKVTFSNNYTVTGSESASWPAGIDKNGDGTLDNDIMCYLNGTELTIASTRSSKIYANKNSNYMFDSWSNLVSVVNMHLFDVSTTTTIYAMFNGCSKLKSIDVSSWNTTNITNMGQLFRNCSSITSLDLSSFDTSNVTYMASMFMWTPITSINLSSFDTSKVTDMSYMFYQLSVLITLDLSSFNTSKVTNMNRMFHNSTTIKTIYVSNWWSTSSVTESDNMFANCPSIVGGAGTTFNSSYVDKTYARVDGGTSSPGYLTNSNNHTVLQNHFYYYQNASWVNFGTTTNSVSNGGRFTPYNITPQVGYYPGNHFDYYDMPPTQNLGSGNIGDSITVNQDLRVDVYYYPNQYTVSYNANGGSGAPSAQTKYYETTLTLSSTVPTRTNYTFLGWSTSSTATSATYSAGGSYTSNSTATLYAVWKSNYTTMYVSSDVTSVLNCRSAPVSGSVTATYSCGTKIVGYDSSTSGWFYYVDGNCYLSKDYLSTTKETCSSGGGSSVDPSAVCTCYVDNSYYQSYSCSSLGSSSACLQRCMTLGGTVSTNQC